MSVCVSAGELFCSIPAFIAGHLKRRLAAREFSVSDVSTSTDALHSAASFCRFILLQPPWPCLNE